MIAKIKTPKKFDELVFLISTTDAVLAIPKTMIFVSIFDNKMTLVYHLCNLFPTYIKKDGERIIKIFTLILESNAKKVFRRFLQ